MPVTNQTPSNLTIGKISFGGEIMTSDEFRNKISKINGYNEYRQYGNDFMSSNKIANGASTVLNVIPQFNALGGLGTTISRGVGAVTGNLSPLEKNATIMLGKQMFFNSVAHLSQQFVPSVNILGPFTGGKLFNFPVDYSITKNSNQGLLDKIVSTAFFKTTSVPDAFQNNPTTEDFLNNTGKAQLSFFYDNINRNVYKQVTSSQGEGDLLTKYASKEYADIKGGITNQSAVYGRRSQPFFNFDDKKFHSYLKNATIYSPSDAVNAANNAMKLSFKEIGDNITQEYAPDDKFIVDNFGKTNKTKPVEIFTHFVSNDNDDDIKNKLVWGRDGVDFKAQSKLAALHGDTDYEQNNLQLTNNVLSADFKIKSGLLEYTRNLLNSTSGHFVDITRKVFTEGNVVEGFNGSPLWRSNSSTYAVANRTAGKSGLRQHSMLDQYDRFAKTIRFKGNVVYKGNPNSVVHQSVMPRIHPTFNNVSNDNNINNKNLMFSIENLAIKTIVKDNYGIINDEWGSPIPMSEVGPFRGRIMWFAPYDLQLNETAMAKYESTVMVGRSEPMYNYMNSERSATLSFTLLMDYPPHVRNFSDKNNSKKDISDFFAFGGDPLPDEAIIGEIELKIEVLKAQLNGLGVKPKTKNNELDSSLSEDAVNLYFPNNVPTGQTDNIVDIMYKDYQYEIISGLNSGKNGGDGNGFGLNKLVFYLTGLTKSGNTYALTVPEGFSQYNVKDITGQFGSTCKLNDMLNKFFSNPENRKLYTITIEGGASKLYQGTDAEKYNLELSKRRIQAAKSLVVGRLMTMFSDTTANDYVWNTSNAYGSQKSSDAGLSANNMHNRNVKEERYATIKIVKNENTPELIESDTNSADVKTARILEEEISSLETLLNRLKSISPENVNDYLFNPREKAMLRSDEAIINNNYVPALHSQTPEEFHRRLTFLQQCTRQGSAKATNMTEEDGVLRAKNSVFGRQPICILRVGDFFYTKVIVESVTVDYSDSPWDMNPEGFGMQPMLAKITLQMKLIGGHSLKGPIDILQNAVSFNYYANSTFSDVGMYARPAKIATDQEGYIKGVINNSDKEFNKALGENFKPITKFKSE